MTRCLKQLIQQKVKMILISSTPYRLVIVLFLLFLWPPCAADANIIFYRCGFFFFLSFFPGLISAFTDVYHTSAHDVALVRIWNASPKCAARDWLKIQDAKIIHLRTITQNYLSGYIFAVCN